MLVFSLSLWLSVASSCETAQGNTWKDMLLSLPAEANAVALIDLDQMRSEAGKKGSDPELASLLERMDKIMPQNIRRMVMAASVNLDTLEPEWEASVGNITKSWSIDSLAKSLDGYVDDIENEKVIWSKRGFYLRMVSHPRSASCNRRIDAFCPSGFATRKVFLCACGGRSRRAAARSRCPLFCP